ncbi:MAG: hypothetical protein GWN21_14900 [Gammaproteobacteria bacterium]|nr:hypothetical protein [Gammaproteobacteria bacterium]NIM73703.1 hypothetical protein [Gammaproteobacteria bacterium]NIO25536.1 hypothetical protein [Gammaproteobacteria bacterium]NIP47475.1 hypothetical protein [Gammaproteobacteria bacterium]NIP89595.1 hypothetical protein [Gammaproteobacteria bacterium]
MFNPLHWLPGRQIDDFSRELAAQLASRYPPELSSATPSKKRDKKLGRALNHVYRQARDFTRERRLGVYGRARLGNGFKWELREMGYQQAFVEDATKGLILQVRGK